jgi:hypothetical protein
VEFVINSLVVDLNSLFDVFILETEALETNFVFHAFVEIFFHGAEGDSIVRSLGSGKARDNRAKVELHDFSRVVGGGLRAIVLNEHVLLFEISLNHLDVAFVSTSKSHSSDGHIIDGEVTHSCSVLRSHVSDGSTIGKGKLLDSITEEFNEFTNNTSLT